uniref:hypothetical protein n=1 Tax=Agrobacterium genomosp. 6 TaxID=1183411 RepID=UPI001FEF7C66|nr:hypothetical protein [Agrobacterium genomosp. 6]
MGSYAGRLQMQADLIQRIGFRSGLGAPVHRADDHVIAVPHEKLCMNLWFAHRYDLYYSLQPFTVSDHVLAFGRTGLA